MITTRYLKDNLEAIRKSLEKRKSNYPLDDLLKADGHARKLERELQDLRARLNKGSLKVSELKKAKKDAENEIKELAELKEKIVKMEAELPKYQDRIDFLLMNLPNILHESVPYGKDESENVEVRKWGTPHSKKGVGHEEALVKLGLLDIEQASRVAGSRFFYMKGDLALMEQALIRFAITELTKKGFTLIAPPMMMRRQYYQGVTALGDFEDVLYRAAESKEASQKEGLEHVEDELFLISTSEHPIAAMHAGQIFSAKDLPKKYIGFSPCFRREAGAHGKDTKGIYRVHQFYKIEQFIFSTEDSWKYFDELIGNTEDLVKKLKLPYRVVNICTGDIGTVASKKFDVEVHMPVQGKYGEVASCSNCTNWQSMRLGIKYDEKGERKSVHTLNDTAIATNRMLVAIVENYLNEDGTITVPDALVPYMGKSRIG
jgi:seryl-tRNA synthetase